MKDKKENRILFGPGGCLTRTAIELFIDGLLNEREKKKAERHARGCDLCADTLEGASYFKSGVQFRNGMRRLDSSRWRQNLESGRKSKLFIGLSSVAASVALLLGIYFVFQVKNVVEENGGNFSNQRMVAVEEEIRDSIQVNKIDYKEISTEHTISAVDKGVASSTKQEVQQPQLIQEELAIVEDDEVISFDNEIVFEEVEEEEELEMIVLAEEQTKEDELATVSYSFADVSQDTEYEKTAQQGFISETSKKRAAFKSREKGEVDSRYYVAEVMPMFRGGGMEDFNKYLVDSLKAILPDSVLNEKIIVGFRIDTNGKVDNVKLISGTSSKELNKEIVKLVKRSPVWMPAQLNGEAVAVDQQIEVVLNNE